MKAAFICVTSWIAVLTAAVIATPPPVPPATGFAREYAAPADYGGWVGQIDSIPNTTNYLLTAYSGVTNSTGPQTVVSLARLGSDGSVDWALSATQGMRGELTLRAIPDQPLVFAKLEGLPEEDFWTVFGLFNARDGTRVFERGIPVIVDQASPGLYQPESSAQVDVLADGRSTVLLGGPGGSLHAAVLDRTGTPEWEQVFSASSFTGGSSQLIEYPGKGFWLLVQGSRAISTDPNPPAVNTALTLNIVRLSDKGEVLWTSKLAGLLTSMPRLSLRPIAIGPDGTLVLPLTDTIINTWGTPTLLDVVTYLLVVAPDGTLRWARRIPGVTLATPLLSANTGANALVLFGQKLVSPTAIVGDSVVLRLNLSTGALVAQTSVSHSAAIYLAPAGMTQNQVFFQATTPLSTSGTTALIGSLNLSLSGAVWKQFDPYSLANPTLSINPKTSTLLFSGSHQSKVEAITLDANLNPLPVGQGTTLPCPFFSDRSVPLVNPDVRVETLVPTPSFLSMSVAKTDIPLLSSARIELRTIHPPAADLCPDQALNSVPLAIEGNPSGGGLTVSFQTQEGRTYELLFTPTLSQPFKSIEEVTGDGKPVSRLIGSSQESNGFFSVRAGISHN